MYVSSIFVDRFGRRSNLRIENLCDGLNVLFGPSGSGKTSLVDFLRAMWIGFDSEIRDRYLPTNSRGFGGSVTMQTAQGRQTITRYDDGGHEGRLTVEREDGAVIGRRHLQGLIGNVSPAFLDRVFVVDFQQRPKVSDLVQVAVDSGMQLWGRRSSAVPLATLERATAENREQLAQLPRPTEAIEVLRQRRRDLTHELERLRSHPQVSDDYRQRSNQLEQEIASDELLQNELRRELVSLDRDWKEIDAHRLGTVTRLKSFMDPQDLFMQVKAIDSQLARWKRTLRELVVRKRRIARFEGQQVAREVSVKPVSLRRQLRALRAGIARLEQDLAGCSQQACNGQELQSTVSKNVQGLKSEVTRLSVGLQQHRNAERYRRNVEEHKQLARAESELRQVIRSLSKKQQALVRQLAAASQQARLTEAQQPIMEQPNSTAQDQQLAATSHSANQAEPVLAALARVEDLRRNKRSDLEWIRLRLGERRRQLHDLKADTHGDRQIASVETKLSEVEQKLRTGERWHQLAEEISKLEVERRQWREESAVSAIVDEASAHLCRLTAGEWTEVHVTSAQDIWIENERGQRQEFRELEAGTRDQLYLALCLALVSASEKNGIRLPLVLNSTFANYPAKQIREAIALLREFASGRQVLCLTRHEHVVSEARLLNVPVRILDVVPGQALTDERPELTKNLTRRPAGAIERLAPVPLTESIATRVIHDDRNATFARVRRPDPNQQTDGLLESPITSVTTFDPLPVKTRTTRAAQSKLIPTVTAEPVQDSETAINSAVPDFLLHEYDAIDCAPSIDETNAGRLRGVGIMRVGDLLRASAVEIAGELQGVGVAVDMIHSWQSQARLLCGVRGLKAYDARILVACGITNPKQLISLSPAALRSRVKDFSASPEGQAILLSGTESELSQVTDWIRSMHDQNEWMREDRSHRKSAEQRAHDQGDARQVGPASSVGTKSSAKSRSESNPRPRCARKEIARYDRVDSTTPSVGVHRSHQVSVLPWISSGLTGRLEKIGIVTVGDLLDGNPETIAARLQVNRLTAATLRRWQSQTEFVCQLPHLECHDAQILVAIGVMDVTTLAGMSANSLSQRVNDFCESLEGKRILKNRSAPTVTDVINWIQWARSTRLLNAA